jgi:integrase
MNFVEPIRDRKKIAQIKNLLRGQGRFRDLLLFTVGVNTALRISDLLQLRIGQFLDERGRYKRRLDDPHILEIVHASLKRLDEGRRMKGRRTGAEERG